MEDDMKKKFKDSENGKKPENEQREEAPAENAVPEEAAEETESVLDLKPLLEASRQKAEEYLNLAQRVQADFDNFRKRNQSVRADAYEEGGRDVIASLLPVIDNLERAVGIETTNPIFDHCEEIGDVGVPAFVFEDGRVSIDPADAGLIEYGSPAACSIEDHKSGRKGC